MRISIVPLSSNTLSGVLEHQHQHRYSSRFATRTLDFVSSRTEKFDRSELRYFVVRLSSVMTGKGISVDMARAVVRLFEEENVKKSLSLSDSERAHVQNLLRVCKSTL